MSIRLKRLQGNKVEKRVADKGNGKPIPTFRRKGQPSLLLLLCAGSSTAARDGGQLMFGEFCSSPGSLCNSCAEPQPCCLQHSPSLAPPATQAAKTKKNQKTLFPFCLPTLSFLFLTAPGYRFYHQGASADAWGRRVSPPPPSCPGVHSCHCPQYGRLRKEKAPTKRGHNS